MYFDEFEGRILARCLADAIQAEIKTGASNEWQVLSEEAIASLARFALADSYSSTRIARIVQNAMLEYKRQSLAVCGNGNDLKYFINQLLVDAINNPDVQLEWYKNQEERFLYSRRFLLSRIKVLEERISAPESKKIVEQLKPELEALRLKVQACSDPVSACKKIENALNEMTLVGKAVIKKESVSSIRDRLVTIISSFEDCAVYLSAVRDAVSDYRIQTSCAGGFSNFFTVEDSKDKSTLSDLKKVLKPGKNGEEEKKEVKRIISAFQQNQPNMNSILFAALRAQGLVKAPKVTIPASQQPLLALPTQEEDHTFLL